jgi:hypothetical protein
MRLPVHPRVLIEPPLVLPPDDQDDNGVLLLSMRKVSDLVGYCALYELEDLIADLLGSGIGYVTNDFSVSLARKMYKAVRLLSGSRRLADTTGTVIPSVTLPKRYDLFLSVFNHIYEVFALNALSDWRKRCDQAVCYLGEAWTSELPLYLVEQLRAFDHIFVGVAGATEELSRLTGRPCSYLPRAVDALKFCPYPTQPERSIDVCGIGRRSAVTHEALLAYAQGHNRFYYYDTLQVRSGNVNAISYGVTNPAEHRLLLSNVLKRSRYFIANRAFADRPLLTQGQEEISGRFYEGAAAGSIMLGLPPNSAEFREQFDWEGSLIPTPFHAPEIADTIAQLDRDPARLARLRKASVVNSLRRHDWVYRLRTILSVLGRQPTERMLARERQLSTLASSI